MTDSDTPREQDRDALADIIWLIKGAQLTDSAFPLGHHHIEALRRYRVTNVEQIINKTRKELSERCDQIIDIYQSKNDELQTKLRAQRREKKVQK